MFNIGLSPVGTIPLFDPWETTISQYANSPRITGLITSFYAALDQTADFDAFFDQIWNIDTAQGYGLDVWGRILRINRVVRVSTGAYFGFEQALPGVDTFAPLGVAPFYAGEALTTNYALPDPVYRQLLLIKAAFNITTCTIEAINALLMSLFPGFGTAYCTDPGGMATSYVFSWDLIPVQFSIVTQTGVLPKPCGVAATIVTPSASFTYNPPIPS